MPAKENLVGKKYGQLTAIKEIEKKPGSKLINYQWLCDCGNMKEASGVSVKNGRVKSCGCLRKKGHLKSNYLDLTGKRYARLTVIKRSGTDKHKKANWLCQCECGNKKMASTDVLRKGKTRSCGCLRREVVKERMSKPRSTDEQKEATKLRNRKKHHKQRKEDPVKNMHARINRLFRFAISRVNGIKTSPTLETLGFTAAELVNHLESLFSDGMGWHNMDKWQIDHIMPISTAKTLDDVVRLNQLSNLQPLWSWENNAKKDKLPEDYAKAA